MATTKTVALSTTPKIIVAAGQGSSEAPLQVLLRNTDASIVVRFGGPAITATVGYPIATSSALGFPVTLQGDALYAVSASGTPSIEVTVFGGQ